MSRQILPSPPRVVSDHSILEIEKAAAWLLGMAVAVMIFFQVHVELPTGVLNLNLADPFAILALAAVSLHALLLRQPPQWRIAEFNRILLLFSALLLIGFVVGWLKIGVTQWALGGRLMGWLVLLGYLSAGYLIAAHAGAKGRRRLGETLVATAVIIVLWQVLSRTLHQQGWDIGQTHTLNFEGYGGNRNAFAFQLLAVMALLLGYFRLYARRGGGALLRVSLLLGILLAGIVWTGSRTGMLTGAIMLLVGGLSGMIERRVLIGCVLIVGVLMAAVLWGGEWLAGQSATAQRALYGDASNQERWATIVHAFELWRQSPIFGAGLGVFIAKSSVWLGNPQVIHSTPVWVLVEFGLLGVVVMGWALIKLVRYALPAALGKAMPSRAAFLFLLLMFGLFSQVHEMFYQRILWLLMGALLALPFTTPRREDGH